MEIQKHTLPNGIRLVHQQTKSLVAHFGFMVHTGSRDENQMEHGMAHFIEHVIFKGTKKRKTWHIISRLEDVGGDINAFTTKEDTCIHASFLRQDYERAIELIFDICFNPTFPEKELDKEKGIIIDEILSYEDSPSELIFDEFEELVFQEHSIGRSILGEEKLLAKFNRMDIRKFMQDNYSTREMVLASSGDLDFDKYILLCTKYFGRVPEKTRTRKRIQPNSYAPTHKSVRKDTHQGHCIIGNIAYDASSDKRVPMALLNNILGGPGMNSRLNLNLREKRGYTYQVESHYTPYSDTGIFQVYFGSDKDKMGKVIRQVQIEFDLLNKKKLGVLQLSRAKRQLIGQIAISSESNESFMLSMAKNILTYNHVHTLNEISQMIESVSPLDILEVANEVLDKNNLTILQYY